MNYETIGGNSSNKEDMFKGVFIKLPSPIYYKLVGLAAEDQMEVSDFLTEFVIGAYKNAQAFRLRTGSDFTKAVKDAQQTPPPSKP